MRNIIGLICGCVTTVIVALTIAAVITLIFVAPLALIVGFIELAKFIWHQL